MFLSVMMLSCGSDDNTGPTLSDQELAYAQLAGSWSLQDNGSFTVDGQDVSINYPGFRISFTNGGYSTNNAGELFKPSGSWNWANAAAGAIDLDDGKTISISSLTASSFSFTFQFSGTGGTANGVGGSYNITLNK